MPDDQNLQGTPPQPPPAQPADPAIPLQPPAAPIQAAQPVLPFTPPVQPDAAQPPVAPVIPPQPPAPQEAAPPADEDADDKKKIATLEGQLATLMEKTTAREKEEEAAKLKEEEAAAAAAGTMPDLLAQRTKELEAARLQLDTKQKRLALEEAATKAGLANKDYLAMIPAESVTLEGEVVRGAEEAVEALKGKYPALFTTPTQSPSSPLPGGAPNAAHQAPRELTPALEAVQKYGGWEAFGNQYKDPRTGRVETFDSKWLDPFTRTKQS